jgi:hypothetical protein
MTRLCLILVLGSFIVLSAGSAHAALEDNMNEAEFRAAGLHKLTDAELATLNRWLDKSAGPVKATPATPVASAPALAAPTQASPPKAPQSTVKEVTEFGQEQLEVPVAAEVPTAITARLKGEFRGWDGDTIFRLDNGQVWQQRVGGKYRSSKLMDPEVELEKGRFGYYLKVLSSGRSVGVKRIR